MPVRGENAGGKGIPVDFERKEKYGMDDLKSIMRILRGENGCPWDKVQTHESIRSNFIEETYEVCEAIDKQDAGLLREELGDVLLQVVFHSQMEAEQGSFDFDDVANDICQKLIIRHPHIFSSVQVDGVEDVLDNWNAIKQKTKGQTTASETLESVPRQFPALMRSQKVQSRAGKANPVFGYSDSVSALEDLKSEVAELDEAVKEDARERIAEEAGDVLFAAVNVIRQYGMDAEELLTRSCDKFMGRFKKVEEKTIQRGTPLHEVDSALLDELWQEVKAEEKA